MDNDGLYKEALAVAGEPFELIRDEESKKELEGVKHKGEDVNRKHIGFLPSVDIQRGDWLTNQMGDKYFIYEVEGESGIKGKPHKIKAYYKTEREVENDDKNDDADSQKNVFKINNARDSIIGTQEQVNQNITNNWGQIDKLIEKKADADDKEQLKEMISELKETRIQQPSATLTVKKRGKLR